MRGILNAFALSSLAWAGLACVLVIAAQAGADGSQVAQASDTATAPAEAGS